MSDELWLGMKDQSNWEIAGSLRNILRYSLEEFFIGGRALNGLGPRQVVPNPIKLRMPIKRLQESDLG